MVYYTYRCTVTDRQTRDRRWGMEERRSSQASLWVSLRGVEVGMDHG
jgi:hypothetical protein